MSPAVVSNRIAWLGLAVLILVIDFLTGPAIQFPFLFLAPIALATMHAGKWWGLSLAVGMPLVRFGFDAHWSGVAISYSAIANAGIRIGVLAAFAILTESALRVRALSKEIRVLRGILPICSFCNRIRKEGNTWVRIDAYITEHSEAHFSHGLCPECLREHYPELPDARGPEAPT